MSEVNTFSPRTNRTHQAEKAPLTTKRNNAISGGGSIDPSVSLWDASRNYIQTEKNRLRTRFEKRLKAFITELQMRPGQSLRLGFDKLPPININIITKTPHIDGAVKSAISKIWQSVVMVKAVGQDSSQRWSGSGTIVNLSDIFPGIKFPEGVYGIITNNHVAPAKDTKYLTVTLANKEEVPATIMSSFSKKTGVQDETVDAAILIIKSRVPLPTATIAQKPPEIGDTILTAGHPIGLPNMSFTKGIVSQNSQETGEAVFVIQHDAEINPGNSGGPLFNLNGEILGLNTFSFRNTTGLSFAIPIGTQLEVLNSVLRTGDYIRGSFGFDVKDFSYLDRQLSGFPLNIPGAKVAWVDAGSEASRLGIKPDDIIARIASTDGSELDMNIHNKFQVTRFLQWMHKRSPGSGIMLLVYHKIKDGDKTEYKPEVIRMTVKKLNTNREILKSDSWGFMVRKDANGKPIIAEIDRGSPAGRSNLTGKKWVLLGIKAKEISNNPILINNLNDFKEILMTLEEAEAEELTVFVADVNDPRIRKRIVLKREIIVGFLGQKATPKGIETYLAA